MTSVETQIEAEQIVEWFHVSSPLDNAEVYAVLLAGLTEVRSAYHAARAAHDHARAAELLPEWVDLTYLCGAARAALDCQRRTWLTVRAPGWGPPLPWPLGRVG